MKNIFLINYSKNILFGLVMFSCSLVSAQKFLVKDGLVVVSKEFNYQKQQQKELLKEVFSASDKISFMSLKTVDRKSTR